MTTLASLLGTGLPLIQAPMAGVQDEALALAVARAGGLGSLPCALLEPARLEAALQTFAAQPQPINLNFFCHTMAEPDPGAEQRWRQALAPYYDEYGIAPPAPSTAGARRPLDAATVELLAPFRPRIVSFHFGLPDAARLAALRDTGITLLATATSPREAAQAEAAGVHALVAQGIEAGGHRGVFDGLPDERIGTFALVRLLVRQSRLPVVAAGGIMDGAGVAAALRLGAAAAQLGTAFIACPESSASPGHRAALADGRGTVVTAAISGRPARGLENRFTAEFGAGEDAPGYPFTYDAGKALHQAAMARGEEGYAAWWAGQGAPLARAMPAAALVATLVREAGLEG